MSSDGKSPKQPAVGTREVLHQRRKMPFSNVSMAAGGFLMVAAIGYLALYSKSAPGTTPSDVAKATVGPGVGNLNNAGQKPK